MNCARAPKGWSTLNDLLLIPVLGGQLENNGSSDAEGTGVADGKACASEGGKELTSI